MTSIHTERLELVPLSTALVTAALRDRGELARLLGAEVSPEWPNPDSAVLVSEWAEALAEEPVRETWRRLVVLTSPRRLIGDLGAADPPDEGMIEIGYGIVPEARGRGLAQEAVGAFCRWALDQPGVDVVVAETQPHNAPSAGVLRAVGFTGVGVRRDPVDGRLLRWRLLRGA